VLPFLKAGFGLFVFARLLGRLQSPVNYLRRYQEERGMDFWRDVEDWLGGLPYEYCKPDQVVNFMSDRGLTLLRLRTESSIGNNEFLFRLENVSHRTK
jgi:2-polyprenyl-6-hydroxyphenyl methylase/3-demethylubiquinone-9 3-methyltransferase